MRFSSIQNNILFILYAIEQKGHQEPVPSMSLLSMINGSRAIEVFDSNFRASCHKLNKYSLLDKHRCPTTLKLSWSLSETGRIKAAEVFTNKLKQVNISAPTK